VVPSFPGDFVSDLQHKKLPKVSWILLSIAEAEHPGQSDPTEGELGARQLISELVSHTDTWRKTALFITWDENGGFFDHVAPPAPPAGTAGEYLTVATLPQAAGGIRGPIGLGFRVPMLVVSPFSRGGLVCSDVFDHTSTLRFLETRFGAKVPNLSKWRRHVTGDLTSALNFAARPNAKRPKLVHNPVTMCTTYPAVQPAAQAFPKQPKRKRRKPSGIV
jgi:phospholipase C